MPVKTIYIPTLHQGFYNFTHQVVRTVREFGIAEGLCTLFIQHTSASLLIQENADPAVLTDLQNWFHRLVPERDPLYTHTLEGADDMPAHIKSVLTATSLSIPIMDGQLVLGTWQGIYLWEHRHHNGSRSVVVHIAD